MHEKSTRLIHTLFSCFVLKSQKAKRCKKKKLVFKVDKWNQLYRKNLCVGIFEKLLLWQFQVEFCVYILLLKFVCVFFLVWLFEKVFRLIETLIMVGRLVASRNEKNFRFFVTICGENWSNVGQICSMEASCVFFQSLNLT